MAVSLRLADAADAERLNGALSRLSDDLGDTHKATTAALFSAGWRPHPVFRAQLAEAAGDVVGVALYSPCFSTVRGGAGIYVSDLWAAREMRGQGLGRRLLAAALADASGLWGAGFVKLSAYHASADAMRFYTKLGFRPLADQHDLILDADGCSALGGAP